MDYKEKQQKVTGSSIKDLNLRLVKPITANEIEQLKGSFKKGPKELWKYLQKKELYRGKK